MKPEQWPFTDLLAVSTMTLATTWDGKPHATPVYFVADDQLNLYYFSEGKSQHSQHIVQNHRVAAAIYPECEGWQEIRGLQIHGKVNGVTSQFIWDVAWNLYREKFPFTRSMKIIVSKNKLYVLVPEWIRFVDNTKRFGYKAEWSLI